LAVEAANPPSCILGHAQLSTNALRTLLATFAVIRTAATRLALRKAQDELIEFITDKSETELYGGPMAEANNDWTPGRWAEAAGPSHFRSASKYIRARLRTG